MATDPVCGMTVDEKSAAGSAAYQGATYYFCSENCLRKFEANQAAYVHAGSQSYGMNPHAGRDRSHLRAVPGHPAYRYFPRLGGGRYHRQLGADPRPSLVVAAPAGATGAVHLRPGLLRGGLEPIRTHTINIDFQIAPGTSAAYFYNVTVIFFSRGLAGESRGAGCVFRGFSLIIAAIAVASSIVMSYHTEPHFEWYSLAEAAGLSGGGRSEAMVGGGDFALGEVVVL